MNQQTICFQLEDIRRLDSANMVANMLCKYANMANMLSSNKTWSKLIIDSNSRSGQHHSFVSPIHRRS